MEWMKALCRNCLSILILLVIAGGWAGTSFAGQLVGSGAVAASYIVDIDHEENDFSEYTTTELNGGSLSIAAGAALNSTNYGMSVYNSGTNAVTYGRKNFPSATYSDLRIRVYFDPNSVAMDDYQAPYWCWVRGSANTIGTFKVRKVGTQYTLRFQPSGDSGTLTEDTDNITDSPHYIEFYYNRSASAVSSDGSVEWWIDGASAGSWTSVDNYDLMSTFSYIDFGSPLAAPNSSVIGTWYIDEVLMNDTGNAIGP